MSFPISRQVSSTVLVSAFRARDFSFEKACSIGLEFGRVRWQEDQGATGGGDQVPHGGTFVDTEIVHGHHLPAAQARTQGLQHVGDERRRGNVDRCPCDQPAPQVPVLGRLQPCDEPMAGEDIQRQIVAIQATPERLIQRTIDMLK